MGPHTARAGAWRSSPEFRTGLRNRGVRTAPVFESQPRR